MRESLAVLSEAKFYNPGKVSHLVRVLPAWGKFPWIDLTLTPNHKQLMSLLTVSVKLSCSFLLSIFYFMYKYFAYLPYRLLKPSKPVDKNIAWFSPSAHLDEFHTQDSQGFWGQVKEIDSRLSQQSIWFQIPFRPPNKSHFELMKEIRLINESTDYLVVPIGRFFSIICLAKLVWNSFLLHKHLIRKWLTKEVQEISPCVQSLILNDQGFPVARSLLNDTLIEVVIFKFTSIETVFTLLEGQPWEISLLRYARQSGSQVIGNVHIPFRERDTQILNHFITPKSQTQIYNPYMILCSDPKTHEKLIEIADASFKISLVEAQRFMVAKKQSREFFAHDPSSLQILYVADSNHDHTQSFESLIEGSGLTSYEFLIKPHPASSRKNTRQLPQLSHLTSPGFALVVFGSDTSAYLQSEYEKSNAAILRPDWNASELTTNDIPQISTLSDLVNALRSPVIMKDLNTVTPILDNSLKRWRQVVNEVR